ncbi:MAG: hypothetical protein CL678_12365 [Bdellovibrionaceae bacterium]|nr:hypothetical protein [Pseudobdellovibrionaceae bacterium]|tara:strand:+ start:913 stop:1407 length:495 start_codon:yes stop_codon:yes gene_type:complete
MKNIALLMQLVAFIMTVPAFAKDGGDIQGGGSDGCGLGWQVTQKKSLFATATRGTTNSFVPPTFGMTTGTIGCDKHKITKNEQKEAAVYAETNFEMLSDELATGNGEYLVSFAETLGCADAASFGAMTKANYNAIMPSYQTSAAEMLQNVRTQIQSSDLNCSVL